MKKITEDSIEKYIRFPEELTAEEKSLIGEAIQRSPEVKAIYEWLSDFYEELDSISEQPLNTFALLKKDFPAAVDGPAVLAARSADTGKNLKVKAVLVSEEQGILLRVLEDESRSEVSLYMLSRDRVIEYPILTLTESETDLVLDKNGKLKGEKGLEKIGWNNAEILLRLPVGSVRVNCETIKEGTLKRLVGGKEISFRCKDGRIQIDTGEENSGFSRVLLVQDEERTLYPEAGRPFEMRADTNKKATIYLYE